MAADALHELVSAYAGSARIIIKWPNDLLHQGAKLSGILLERQEDSVVIGFGVNLAGHPEDSAKPATSLLAITGSAPDAALFLDDLATSFARWLGRWRSEGLAPIRHRWLDAAHPAGTPISTILADGERAEGLFDGLDESGALRLRLADGSLHVIHAGDVFLI